MLKSMPMFRCIQTLFDMEKCLEPRQGLSRHRYCRYVCRPPFPSKDCWCSSICQWHYLRRSETHQLHTISRSFLVYRFHMWKTGVHWCVFSVLGITRMHIWQMSYELHYSGFVVFLPLVPFSPRSLACKGGAWTFFFFDAPQMEESHGKTLVWVMILF